MRIADVQGLWTLAQGAGQQVRVGALATTLGTAGSITSTVVGDTLNLVCWTANTLWVAVDPPQGVLVIA